MAYNPEELQVIKNKIESLKYDTKDIYEIYELLHTQKPQSSPVYVNQLVSKANVMLALLPVALIVGSNPTLSAKWGVVMTIATGLPDMIDISGEGIQSVLMAAVKDGLISEEVITNFIASAKQEVLVTDAETQGLKELTLQDLKASLSFSA